MDSHVFDRIVRTLGTSVSRRAAIGALMAASPLAAIMETTAKKRNRRKANSKDKNKGGKGRDNDKGKGKGKGKAKAQAENCWRSGACILRKGANASQCNLAGYTAPPNLDCTRCNISRANLRGADLSGANLTAANLSGSCLIDANLTGAIIANTTNLYNAIFCRTIMPDGSINNSGCGLGTECCAACDATHPCLAGQRCCSGRCLTGQCCVAGDCADQTCRGKECTNNTCTYTNQSSGTGGTNCADPRQCCNGICCPAGQTCCGGSTCCANGCNPDGSCVAACGAGGPCLVFLSSTRHTGNLGGLAGADAICQQLASAVPLPGTYKAWLSDSVASPSTRFMQSSGPYRLVDGTTIANNWADLTDGNLAAQISTSETGVVESSAVWTHTLPNGTAGGSGLNVHCDNWLSTAVDARGDVGTSGSTASFWTDVISSGLCASFTLKLYCFQQS
jgi:hypothetical protein